MSKKNIILGILLIILVAVAWTYNGPYQDWKTNKGKPKNIFSGLDVKKIDKIELTSSDQKFVLTKEGDKWRVNNAKGFYVQADIIQGALGQLEAAQKAELEIVSQNKDKKSDFGTDQTGQEVKLYEGDKVLLDFVVGNLASDYISTYIAEINSDMTYQVAVSLASALARNDWYDKTIFTTDKTKINKIRFQINGEEFVVQKQGDKWQGVKPKAFAVSSAKIEEAIGYMSSLTAAEIPEQKFAGTGLEKNNLIIQASGEGVDNTLMIGANNGKGLFYAKKSTSDNIYLISQDQEKVLSRKMTELK
jgi:hypothetical protein